MGSINSNISVIVKGEIKGVYYFDMIICTLMYNVIHYYHYININTHYTIRFIYMRFSKCLSLIIIVLIFVCFSNEIDLFLKEKSQLRTNKLYVVSTSQLSLKHLYDFFFSSSANSRFSMDLYLSMPITWKIKVFFFKYLKGPFL